MTAPGPRRTAMPFGRRLALTVAAVAILPLVAFGLFATSRVEASLASASEDRVRDALTAVDAVLARRQQALAETAAAYGDWTVTADLVARGQTTTIRDDILAFVEGRGSADLATAVIDGRPLTTGTDEDAERLASLQTAPAGPAGIVPLGHGLAQVAVAVIGAAPNGATTADVDRLVFADRLDSDFALEVRRLTGFDVAVIGPDGAMSVASDPTAAMAVAAQVGAVDDVTRDGALAAGWTHPDGAAGSVILVSTRQDAVQSLLGPLPAVLLGTLIIAAIFAVLVAVIVGRDLNLRLAAIHGGLVEVAAGRRPQRDTVSGGPDVDRLADALDGLVAAMDRRARILRDASMTVAGWHPEFGVGAVEQAATDGALEVFGLRWCALVRPDGTRAAASGVATDGEAGSTPPKRVEAPLSGGPEASGWLIADAPADGSWTESDDALFGMYALLVGGALDDAAVHDATSDRLERLGRSYALQREFLRSVSHNLQTPLTTITLVADDLADPAARPTPEFRARQVRAIQMQAHRLERLVAQLITVSRLDAGAVHLERDAVAIGPLVRRVWAALDTDRTLDVVDDAGDLIPVGDRDAIEQVLWILLDNAVRYAPSGPIRVATTAEVDGPDPRVRIEVRDDGPGVPEPERRRIFHRFWSGTAGRSRGGTGIGLDIARRLARAMAGTLRYDASRPVGATFVLTLPAEVARPD